METSLNDMSETNGLNEENLPLIKETDETRKWLQMNSKFFWNAVF